MGKILAIICNEGEAVLKSCGRDAKVRQAEKAPLTSPLNLQEARSASDPDVTAKQTKPSKNASVAKISLERVP